jgi:predicted ribosomally synthesized peptide with nif11-like leader
MKYKAKEKSKLSEKGKKFFVEIMKNEELKEALLQESRKSVLAVAEKFGYDLKMEDFAIDNKELSEDELEAVAGGKGGCGCLFLGGGGGGGSVCVCILGGGSTMGDRSCICDIGGVSW